jgi:hypothetical protein
MNCSEKNCSEKGRYYLLIVGTLLGIFLMTGFASAIPTVTTDKADYSPGAIVTVSGSGFEANTVYDIPIIRPDGSIVTGDGTYTPGWDSVTSDNSGAFTYLYELNGIEGLYTIEVYLSSWNGPDSSDELLASTTFTDAIGVTFEGFQAKSPGPTTGWTTGNLGKLWTEGEWVPYKATIINIQDDAPNFVDGDGNDLVIEIKYDFTGGGDKRFVDLVRGIQVGLTDLTDAQGWPRDDGSAYPISTFAEIELAQNDFNNTGSLENVWPNYTLLNLPHSQVHRNLTGDVGTPTDDKRKIIITKTDLETAGISNTTDTLYVYLQLHESRTFIWENSLQSGYDAPPTQDWGGYLYSIPPFNTDSRLGSGYVPGSSGHANINALSGAKTVPIPIPETLPGAASGIKWEDSNGNGIMDGLEEVIEGWEIFVFGTVEGITFNTSTTTDETGTYSFPSLSTGNWTIKEVQNSSEGWTQTYPQVGNTTATGTGASVSPPPADVGPVGWNVTFTIGNSEDAELDFGNRLALGTIIIEKVTVPAGGTGFGFTDDIEAPNSFSLDHGQSKTFIDVPSGQYNVTEDDPATTPGGYELTDLDCNDTNSVESVGTRTATINLEPAETLIRQMMTVLSISPLMAVWNMRMQVTMISRLG